MYYQSRGSVPAKRHTQHRSADGRLYYEELMGEEGFSSDSSLLYHRAHAVGVASTRGRGRCRTCRPCRTSRCSRGTCKLPELFKSADAETTDVVTGRRLVLGNDDVRI